MRPKHTAVIKDHTLGSECFRPTGMHITMQPYPCIRSNEFTQANGLQIHMFTYFHKIPKDKSGIHVLPQDVFHTPTIWRKTDRKGQFTDGYGSKSWYPTSKQLVDVHPTKIDRFGRVLTHPNISGSPLRAWSWWPQVSIGNRRQTAIQRKEGVACDMSIT